MIGLNIFALLLILEEKKEGTNSVKVVSCVKVLVLSEENKVLLEHS